MIWKTYAAIGAAAGALAVASGAFGAHALRGRLDAAALAIYQTAVQYHFYHALGLFAVAFVISRLPDSAAAAWAGAAMCLGLVLFCGSLYLLALTGTRGLGAVAPLGGLAFIVAWLLLAFAVIRG